MKGFFKRLSLIAIGALATVSLSAGDSELEKIMKERGLTQQDILAAAKTYTPSGGRDKYIVFSSGGQSGQVMVYGVPSMRILKYIGVFTPEPWQGWGYDDDTKSYPKTGDGLEGKEITWGGYFTIQGYSEDLWTYDGKWLGTFIG